MGIRLYSITSPLQIDCPIVPGPDADVTGIATYKTKKDELVAVTTTKGGQFISVNIETGKDFKKHLLSQNITVYNNLMMICINR